MKPGSDRRAGQEPEHIQSLLSAQNSLFERVRYQIGAEVEELLAQFQPMSRRARRPEESGRCVLLAIT